VFAEDATKPFFLAEPAAKRRFRFVAARSSKGKAEATNGTSASITWSLSPVPAGTRVSLAAVIESATALDRLLLTLGGRRWLESVVLSEAVEGLEHAVVPQRR
jgi:hypothetical protein